MCYVKSKAPVAERKAGAFFIRTEGYLTYRVGVVDYDRYILFFGRRRSEEPAFRTSVTLIRARARTLRGAPRGRRRVAYNKYIF